ncbi:MAG: adenylate/guanylate cyclase domain-containing protein [Steroidobacteraceae bacterium]|jgi:adenylate cyclase
MLTIPIYSTTGISLIQKVAHPILAESTTATLLVADLRGYTELAEHFSPVKLVPILGEFFALFTRAVLQYGGQIFRVSDTGTTAAFGVCDLRYTHSNDALLAAGTIQRRFAKLRESWKRSLSITAGIGLGMHRGDVAIGAFGPPGHAQPMLIGDAVNVATLLSGRARDGEVLMSSIVNSCGRWPVHEPAGGETLADPSAHLGRIKLQGRREYLDTWCLLAPERPEARAGSEAMRAAGS